MSEVILFLFGCLITAVTFTAVWLIGIGEARDVRRLQLEKRVRSEANPPAPNESATSLN